MTLLRSPIRSSIRSSIYSPLAGKWGGPYDASLFGPADDGFLHNLSQTSLLAQNSNGTTPVTADSDPIGWAKSTVASQRIATQATTSARPFWKTPNFARLDGADDNWLTTFITAPAMSFVLKAKPTNASVVAIGRGPAANQYAYMGVNPSGKLAAGVGSTASFGHASSQTWQNTLGVAALTFDGSSVNLYWNGGNVYNAAQVGAVSGALPVMIGCYRDSGATLSNFMPGDIYNALAINRALTAVEIANLTNYWNAQ